MGEKGGCGHGVVISEKVGVVVVRWVWSWVRRWVWLTVRLVFLLE